MIHCEKYRNFTWLPGVEILRKDTVSAYRANRPKLCGNCAFPQNFRTRKSGEIMVYFPVFGTIILTSVSEICHILIAFLRHTWNEHLKKYNVNLICNQKSFVQNDLKYKEKLTFKGATSITKPPFSSKWIYHLLLQDNEYVVKFTLHKRRSIQPFTWWFQGKIYVKNFSVRSKH